MKARRAHGVLFSRYIGSVNGRVVLQDELKDGTTFSSSVLRVPWQLFYILSSLFRYLFSLYS